MARKRRSQAFVIAGLTVFALVAAPTYLLPGPIVLYPETPSLPVGPYLISFSQIETGKIVAFSMPSIARRYHREQGREFSSSYLYIKPVVAGPGDKVCSSATGLFINGQRFADVVTQNAAGNPLPVWQDCRRLGADEWFMVSTHARESFDSRYYGPIQESEIASVYRPLF